MPELELDTVWEAGEISTGEAIDGSSSISSNTNAGAVNLNMSRPHQFEIEFSTKNHNTKNSDTMLEAVPNDSIRLNKIAAMTVHEDSSLERSNYSKKLFTRLSINENSSNKLSFKVCRVTKTNSCEAIDILEKTAKNEG